MVTGTGTGIGVAYTNMNTVQVHVLLNPMLRYTSRYIDYQWIKYQSF